MKHTLQNAGFIFLIPTSHSFTITSTSFYSRSVERVNNVSQYSTRAHTDVEGSQSRNFFSSPTTSTNIRSSGAEDSNELFERYRLEIKSEPLPILPRSDAIYSKDEELGDISQNPLQDVMMPVLTTSLLITANTVGAGTMILPEVAAGPGFGPTCAMFGFVYILNLISSLLISEVAIKQHENCKTEQSYNTLPASFKELTDVVLGSRAGNAMAFVSLFINMCVLSFALMRGHEVFLSSNVGDELEIAAVFAIVLSGITATLDNQILSKISSTCGITMFTAFAGVVLPALPFSMTHMDVLFPSTASPLDIAESTSTASSIIPILLMLSTFQNITPTVTKLLKYDRFQVVLATIIGSGIPVTMYVVWMFVNMSGGINAHSAASDGLIDVLVSAFLMSSLVGSSIACVISIAEEFESLLKKSENPECIMEDEDKTTSVLSDDKQRQILSMPSVLLSVIPPLAAGAIFSNGEDGGAFTEALDLAGKYGATLLYGLVPVALAWSQRKADDDLSESMQSDDLVPGGLLPMFSLGGCALVYLAQSLGSDIMNAVNVVA